MLCLAHIFRGNFSLSPKGLNFPKIAFLANISNFHHQILLKIQNKSRFMVIYMKQVVLIILGELRFVTIPPQAKQKNYDKLAKIVLLLYNLHLMVCQEYLGVFFWGGDF